MAAIVVGQSSDCTNRILDLFTQVAGIPTDVALLEYQIFDKTDLLAPVQVFPVALGDRALVDQADCPAGDKVSTGHYVARWDAPGDATPGLYEVRWFFKLTLADDEQTFIEEFEVLASSILAGMDSYVLLASLRAQGVTVEQASDARLGALIDEACRFIDRATGQWFDARARTFSFDGSGGEAVLLRVPVIAVSSIVMDGSLVSPEEYVIYNRHISEGLTEPDDRKDPRIMRKNALSSRAFAGSFARGRQNIVITGVFGYTDPERPWGGITQGIVPPGIQRLCMLLVIRNLALLTDAEHGFSVNASRLLSESTREQSYSLSAASQSGRGFAADITGDPEIDGLIALFKAPVAMGSTRGRNTGYRRGAWR